MRPIEIVHVGSCILNAPVTALISEGAVRWALDEGGFQRAPEIAGWSTERGGSRRSSAVYCLDGAIQLVSFLRGKIDVPKPLRYLCDLEPSWQWHPIWSASIDRADVVLLEIASSIGVRFGDYFLSQVEVNVNVMEPLSRISEELRAATAEWFYQGLMADNESVRVSAGAQLAAAVPDDFPSAEIARAVLREARGHHRNASEFVDAVAQVRELMKRPLGLLTHTRTYMPDGRPLPWPADVVQLTLAAAQELDLPVFEPSRIVRETGTRQALERDLCHYQVGFWPVLGAHLLDFIKEVVTSGSAREMIRVPKVETARVEQGQ